MLSQSQLLAPGVESDNLVSRPTVGTMEFCRWRNSPSSAPRSLFLESAGPPRSQLRQRHVARGVAKEVESPWAALVRPDVITVVNLTWSTAVTSCALPMRR
jgi:hypothetical protein